MDSTAGRRVAVVGAGISGVCAAAHLLRAGCAVVVFERCDTAGGVWHFDKHFAHEPSYPNTRPSKGDYTRYDTDEQMYITPPRTPDGTSAGAGYRNIKFNSRHADDIRISHAPPGPCYFSLKNNVPLTLMKTTLLQWPPGLEEFVSQKYLEEYIQQISTVSGVEQVTEYKTRVEKVFKSGGVWKVTTATLTDYSRVMLQTRDFDAVVVASGHYHMPRVPGIPGLKEWKEKFPTRIQHSKTYRSYDGPESHKVLLIGSGTSSCDIARDLALKNIETYQSSRGGVLELPTTFLPETALRIGPVKNFTLESQSETHHVLTSESPLPGHITLQNGSKLCDIHHIVLATGYITSYPFLAQYHNDTYPKTSAGDELLVTGEGDMVHNLHKDIFYIEDPTLAFVGVPYHIATFSLFEFQAQIVARVLAGQLNLPDKSAMRKEYDARVKTKGLGRDFHSLRDTGEEAAYVSDLVEWANGPSSTIDNLPMQGHTEEWLKAYQENKERIKFLIGSRRADPDAGKYDNVTLPSTVLCS